MKKNKRSNLDIKFGFILAAITLALFALLYFHNAENSVSAQTQKNFGLAKWNNESQIYAAKRGNPWVNVLDGKEILTDFSDSSDLRSDFENNKSQPLSLAAADFDEDGTPDIVTGYAKGKSGAVSFLRGNVDAIYPNAPEALKRKDARRIYRYFFLKSGTIV